MGSPRAIAALRRLQTTAHALCFVARWAAWIRAKQRLSCATAVVASSVVSTAAASTASENHCDSQPRYMSFDTRKYDFRAVLLKIFGGALAELASRQPLQSTDAPTTVNESSAQPTASEVDVLSLLHTTTAATSELGFLDLELAQSGELCAPERVSNECAPRHVVAADMPPNAAGSPTRRSSTRRRATAAVSSTRCSRPPRIGRSSSRSMNASWQRSWRRSWVLPISSTRWVCAARHPCIWISVQRAKSFSPLFHTARWPHAAVCAASLARL